MSEIKMSPEAQKTAKRFVDARKALQEFVAEQEEVFQRFYEMSDEYNAAHKEMKKAVAGVDTEKAFGASGFRRNAVSYKNVYDPAKLPSFALMAPGVIKAVDTKALEALVIDGKIDGREIAAARTNKRLTPSVSGPKLVVLSL